MQVSDAKHDGARARLAAGVAAYALGVRPEAILMPTRGSPATAHARHVAMYLCHVAMGMSLSRIARVFERDRSTVAHGCHLIEDRRDEGDFDAWIERLEQGLAELADTALACAA